MHNPIAISLEFATRGGARLEMMAPGALFVVRRIRREVELRI
jgi:hypothetical protein